MSIKTTFIKWLLPDLQKELAPTQPVKPRANVAPKKSNAELILEALPRVMQRSHKNFLPAATGATMDAAQQETHAQLQNAYAVNNTMPASLFGWYAAQSFIGYQLCAILSQHWLVNKACSNTAKKAARRGYTVTVQGEVENPATVVNEVKKLDKDFKIQEHCREFARNNRIFGIRHALFLVDGINYELPFNIEDVTPFSYKGISQIDPYWLTPEFDYSAIADPTNMNFYEPTYWRAPNGTRITKARHQQKTTKAQPPPITAARLRTTKVQPLPTTKAQPPRTTKAQPPRITKARHQQKITKAQPLPKLWIAQ